MSAAPAQIETATDAAYSSGTLDAVAEALFLSYRHGDQLLDQQHSQLKDAVEVLQLAQLDEQTLVAALALSRQSAAERDRNWREVFWKEALRRASHHSTGDRPPAWLTTRHT
ncbi:hypothetical protein Q5424_01175 [Conexibacter sp. JD483]|uniref:hypothetical protein n=1 Tax=unclassified Conexibacter TaxID=2627773 RepID=UPI0027163CAC|nr:MULTISPECIES: hypothetical protein [unclassified Conexibacter]MDO8185840.1 hypothetical protein [Conexibacter sp. CPCC 205706]MDO8198584.1 hypothetical protein [Conexibacter sp. CPCC 205762]MDR9367670.1 hypothetical protein [Conexibacter sp. JD483]